LVDLW